MDKKDVMYIVAALALVLVIALVIKPIATGQPVNTGIATPTTAHQITEIPVQNINSTTPVPITLQTQINATSPPPKSTWDPKATQTIAFVNPATYGLSANQSQLTGTRFNESGPDTNMSIIATIASSDGKSGTTSIMYIPFPYWELVYTLEPATELTQGKFEITPTMGSGIAHSGISGSYSTAKPEFTIQVMDGDDPNRIVRTVTPPGGINLDLWKGTIKSDDADRYPTRTSKYAEIQPTPATTPVDPRPWTEKFYEGQRNYYFIINSQSLASYSLKIQVPTRYIGQY
ncbi:MAG: hypothetical protein WC391_09265 [Methanoregula sp.]|jgi:hypothetical protein